MTLNKNLNLLLNLLINSISAKYVQQIFSIKGECTFLFSNFLLIGLCNSSARSVLEMVLFLIPDLFANIAASPDVFVSKSYRPLNQVRLDIHRILNF